MYFKGLPEGLNRHVDITFGDRVAGLAQICKKITHAAQKILDDGTTREKSYADFFDLVAMTQSQHDLNGTITGEILQHAACDLLNNEDFYSFVRLAKAASVHPEFYQEIPAKSVKDAARGLLQHNDFHSFAELTETAGAVPSWRTAITSEMMIDAIKSAIKRDFYGHTVRLLSAANSHEDVRQSLSSSLVAPIAQELLKRNQYKDFLELSRIVDDNKSWHDALRPEMIMHHADDLLRQRAYYTFYTLAKATEIHPTSHVALIPPLQRTATNLLNEHDFKTLMHLLDCISDTPKLQQAASINSDLVRLVRNNDAQKTPILITFPEDGQGDVGLYTVYAKFTGLLSLTAEWGGLPNPDPMMKRVIDAFRSVANDPTQKGAEIAQRELRSIEPN